MRPHGSGPELERRRRLAVRRVRSGYTQTEVARFLDVHLRTVQRWMRTYREFGWSGLKAQPVPGRPPRLSAAQERRVLSWFRQSPRSFGFPTELWTAGRVTEVIRRKFHKEFHPHYINEWLAQRRITPQKPERQARERDERKVRRWLREEWPRIKKLRRGGVPIWS
jgi:transposase